MVKYIYITLALISILFLMTFDASVLYSEKTAFLFEDNIQALVHFLIFAILFLITKNFKLSIIAAISFELLQFFIESRSFQMIDLLSNLVAVIATQNFIKK